MNRADLLSAWPLVRESRRAWQTSLKRSPDDAEIIRAVAATMARPTGVATTVEELIQEGEFDSASLLLIDAEGSFAPEIAERLEQSLDRGRSRWLAGLRARAAELEARIDRLGLSQTLSGALSSAGGSRRADEESIGLVEAEIEVAEAERVKGLRARLEAAGGDPGLVEPRKAAIELCIDHGALDAAEAGLARGPSADVVSEGLLVPSPPVWPYRGEPLARVVGWFYREGAVPPGFERFRPTKDDAAAWTLLDALRVGVEPSSVLRGLAGVLGTSVHRAEEAAGGGAGYFADLSAPGLHAFGRGRWPDGIPVLIGPGDSLEAKLTGLHVRIHLDPSAALPGPAAVALDVGDVLAVLADPARRSRILAKLGRQLPLSLAFEGPTADVSVRWERSDLPELRKRDKPLLLVGAPGLGKSTILLELADGDEVHSAPTLDEMPTATQVFIDDVDVLDERSLKHLAREIHWARTTQDPSPEVIVSARPETASLLRGLTGDMFEVVELPHRSIQALREQASTTLAWLGVVPTEARTLDRLAFLASGNPTVLFLLCRQLVDGVLRERGARRFEPADLEAAWSSSELRSQLAELAWHPIAKRDGVAEILQAVTDFADAGSGLELDDLAWAISEELGERPDGWLDEAVRVLVGYGLLERTDSGVRVRSGGVGLLISDWLASQSAEP